MTKRARKRVWEEKEKVRQAETARKREAVLSRKWEAEAVAKAARKRKAEAEKEKASVLKRARRMRYGFDQTPRIVNLARWSET